jgi:hypothetical protein
LVPVIETPEIVSAAVPELVSVTTWAVLVVLTVWLPNAMELGLRVAPGAETCVPVPVSGMTCGLPMSLFVKVRVPVCAPAVVGLKAVLMVQEAFCARDVPHVLVSVKPALATMLEMVRVESEVLVRVTACVAVVLPTGSLPNASEVGEKFRQPEGMAWLMVSKKGLNFRPE